MTCTEDVERCTGCEETIEQGEVFGPEKFDRAREMQGQGVRFEFSTGNGQWHGGGARQSFLTCYKYRIARQSSNQFAGCVLDMLHARESFAESREHLSNAQSNLLQFVGDGEARDVELHGVSHRVSNVGGSISITKGE